MLRERGHAVYEYVDSNERLDDRRPLAAAMEAIWSRGTVKRLAQLLAERRPDIAHFHNTYFMISPAAYYACQRANVPVVQTLHNFRMGCANACCSLNGQPCELCVPKRIAWPAVWHGCYRGARTASAAVAAIGAVHKTIGTYTQQVDAYISTSEFARAIHIRSGVPPQLCFVKPNSCQGFAYQPYARPRRFALYAGRLTREKGVFVLLEAWRRLGIRLPLKIAGEGPATAEAHSVAGDLDSVEFLGQVSRDRVAELMREAAFLIQPSLLYENCGLSLVEAFAAGLPSVVSGHGSFAELVEDGRTGLHFKAGDAVDLAAKVAWMAAHDEERSQMGHAARLSFERHFSPDRNYAQLIDIYGAAQQHHAARHCPSGGA